MFFPKGTRLYFAGNINGSVLIIEMYQEHRSCWLVPPTVNPTKDRARSINNINYLVPRHGGQIDEPDRRIVYERCIRPRTILIST